MDAQVIDMNEIDDAAVPGETKAERFRRIANPRAAAAVKRLRLLRQMVEGGNANNYEFTDGQRNMLVTALRNEVEEIDTLMRKRLARDSDDEMPLFV
jgi:hypothetical protein